MNHAKSIIALACLLTLLPLASSADTREPDKHDANTRKLCMNLYCLYQGDGTSGTTTSCAAAATFNKRVSKDGEEIGDESNDTESARFEVECDQKRIFTASAHRYTDHTGTRLQAQTGPFPAVLLPKGALRDGRRYQPSVLELGGSEPLRGYCFIYSGPQ